MSYLYEPPRIATCYRPLIFRNERTSTADVQTLRCDLYVSGTLRATFRKPWYDDTGTFKFDIDAQTVVARNCAPYADEMSTPFEIWDKIIPTECTDTFVPYYLRTGMEVLDSDGYLQLVEGTNETSNTLYALPAIRTVAGFHLDQYYQPSATGDFYFLSNAPAVQNVADGDNLSISWLSRGTEAAMFSFFEADGSGQVVVIRTNADTTEEKMMTLGIGPANILGTKTLSYLAGALPLSLAPYVRYTFSVGTWSDGNYTRESEVRTFNIVPSCEWKQRLYWMGPLGACEQYTFCGQITRKQADAGNVAEMAHPIQEVQDPPVLRPLPGSRGPVKTGIETRTLLEIREPVEPDIGEWLRWIRKSPEVYLEVDGELQAVTVLPGDAEYERSREANAVFALTVLVENELSQEL